MLHIALAKGRIAKKVMKSLANGGYHFPDYSDDSRKLIFTDDASIAAFSHKKAHIVLGSSANLKITTKQDAAIFLLGRKK